MTAIEQAFIKAYGVDSAAATPPPHHLDSRHLTGAAAESLYAPSRPAAAAQHRAGAHFVPPPHIELPATGPRTIPHHPPTYHSARTALPAGGEAEPSTAPPTGPSTAPSIGPTGYPANYLQPPSTPAHPALRAGLEVDHVLWPTVCEPLLTAAASLYDQLAQEVAAVSMARPHVVAVTGLGQGEGRTTALLCLALRLVGRGLRMLLVDGDFAHPDLAAQLGLSVGAGWENVLGGRQRLADVLVKSIEDQLTILPLGPAAVGSQVLAGSVGTRETLAVVREGFDLVLVDAGPMLTAGGAAERLLGRAGIDAAILVCDARQASEATIHEATSRMEASGVQLLGIVENFANESGASPAPAGQRAAMAM